MPRPGRPPALLLTLGAVLVLSQFRPTFCDTPPGACDWISLPQRSSDEQDVLIGIRGECVTIESRAVGTTSVLQISAVFICENLAAPRELWCRVPGQSMGRPMEIRIHGEDPQYDVGWIAEPTVLPPPEPTPPVVVDGGVLRWRIVQTPIVRWFEFEYTAVDVSPNGSTAPVWQFLDAPETWTYCASYTPPKGGLAQFICARDVPNIQNRYRVRACNWSGPNATAGCGPWTEESYLACVFPPNHSSTCPCHTLPSELGCVYP